MSGARLLTGAPNPGATVRQRWEEVRAAEENRQTPFLEWALRVPEPKTGRLDFERFPYQLELYELGAHDREMVVMKATQVGVSAFLVRWTMYHADVRGLTSLYVFPKRQQMHDFADARIRASIQKSDYLMRRVTGHHVQNKGLKQIGLGWLYCRGSESKADLDAVDADCLALDEYDMLVADNIPDAERRITGSQHGLIRRVGVPSYPGTGIDELYDLTDRRRWFVRCDACGERQPLTWDNVDLERAIRVCLKCRKPLDVSRGEWVPEFPDRDVRGYHLPRLIVPTADIGDMIAQSKKTAPYQVQVHHNKDLGVAYAPAEGRLSPEALRAAQREYAIPTSVDETPAYTGENLVTMGVDVATVRPLTVRASEHLGGERKRALFIGEVPGFKQLVTLMDRLNVKMAAIDHEPDGRLARRFAERFAGRVYVVAYATLGAQREQALKVTEDMSFASVRRVEAMDATFEAVRQQRNELPVNPPENYAKEMMTPLRVAETDEWGRATVRYKKSGAADDFAHAETYDLVAEALWWYRQGVEERSAEHVETLDDHVEFERAVLDADTGEYEPGFDSDRYEPGFEE